MYLNPWISENQCKCHISNENGKHENEISIKCLLQMTSMEWCCAPLNHAMESKYFRLKYHRLRRNK